MEFNGVTNENFRVSRMDRIRHEFASGSIDYYQSIMKKNIKEKLKYGDKDDRFDIKKALEHLREFNYEDNNEYVLIANIKELAQRLGYHHEIVNNYMHVLKNKQIQMRIKVANANLSELQLFLFGGETFVADNLAKLLTKGDIKQLANSIQRLTSILPPRIDRTESLQLLELLRLMEKDILEYSKNLSEFQVSDKFALEFVCPTSPSTPFTIVLMCPPYLQQALRKSNVETLLLNDTELCSAFLRICDSDLLNTFSTNSLLLAEKSWLKHPPMSQNSTNTVLIPYEFSLRFTRPVVVLRSVFEELSAMENIVFNTVERINFSQHVSDCFKEIIKLKYETNGGKMIQLYEFQKFGDANNEDVIINEMRFTNPCQLAEALRLIREQLVFTALFDRLCRPHRQQKDLDLDTQFFNNDKTLSHGYVTRPNAEKAIIVRVRLISPQIKTSRLGFIVAFKIGGIVVSAKIAINCNVLHLDVRSVDKTFFAPSVNLKNWRETFKRTWSIPHLVRQIVADIQKDSTRFGSIFSQPLLPIFQTDLQRSFSTFTSTIPHKTAAPILDEFIPKDDRVHKHEVEFQFGKEHHNKQICCDEDDELLPLLNGEYHSSNFFDRSGEAWMHISFHYRSNDNNATDNNNKKMVEEKLMLNNFGVFQCPKPLREIQENEESKRILKHCASQKIENKNYDQLHSFRVEREPRGGLTLLRSAKTVFDVNELVPRRPPYQNQHIHPQHQMMFNPHHHHHFHPNHHHHPHILPHSHPSFRAHPQHMQPTHTHHMVHFPQQFHPQFPNQLQHHMPPQQLSGGGMFPQPFIHSNTGGSVIPHGANIQSYPPHLQQQMQRAGMMVGGPNSDAEGVIPSPQRDVMAMMMHQQQQQHHQHLQQQQRMGSMSGNAFDSSARASANAGCADTNLAAAGLRQFRSSIDSSTTTTTTALNNAFSDLEALAAMGRDDAESGVSSDKIISPSCSSGGYNENAQHQEQFQQQKQQEQQQQQQQQQLASRLHHQQSSGTLSQLSPLEKMTPNMQQHHQQQQQQQQQKMSSGAEVFDFMPDDNTPPPVLGALSSRQQIVDAMSTSYDENIGGNSSARSSSAASNASRRGGGRNSAGGSGQRNNMGRNSGVGSSMESDSTPGTPNPKKSRKSKKSTNVGTEPLQQQPQQTYINQYLATAGAGNLQSYSSIQNAFSTNSLPHSNHASSPTAEESQRNYEMAMLDDSSDEETDPPLPRNSRPNLQSSTQQLQRNQRTQSLADAQNRKDSTAVRLSTPIAFSTAAAAVTSLGGGESSSNNSERSSNSSSTAVVRGNETAGIGNRPKLSLLMKAPDSPSVNIISEKPNTPDEQKNTQKMNVFSSRKSSFQHQQQSQQQPQQFPPIKKEPPPILDIYDAETEWEFKPEKDSSPKPSSSKERPTKSVTSNSSRQKDSTNKSANNLPKESLRRKPSNSSTEPIKLVFKLPKSSHKNNSNSSSSSPSPSTGTPVNTFASSSSYSSTHAQSTANTSFATTSSANISAATLTGNNGEPVARLSSHAAPPSKSKSMHSRIFTDASTARATGSSNSVNRKRTNPIASDERVSNGSAKKRSKESTALSVKASSNGSTLPNAPLIAASASSTKSTKRGSISGASAAPPLQSPSTTNVSSSSSPATESAPTPIVPLFQGLRNFKIPKVPEATGDVNTPAITSLNNSANSSGVSGNIAAGSSTAAPLTAEGGTNQGGSGTSTCGLKSSLTRGGSNVAGGKHDGTKFADSNPSSGIQQQLQRRPNKSILKNSGAYGGAAPIANVGPSSERLTQQLQQQQQSYRALSSANSQSSGKSRKTLLPNQNARPQQQQQTRQQLPNCGGSGGVYARNGVVPPYARDRKPVLDTETWAPAFRHHQEQQQQLAPSASSIFHGGAGGVYGPPPPLLPYSQQTQHLRQKTENTHMSANNISGPPVLQQQQHQHHTHLPSRHMEDEPMSPDGLQIAEDE